jgi:NADP-dependent 3-hydroxy acid dehydrogenase YdfG
VLDGKAVAITGASSGIGEAAALAFAARGAAVALGARRADRLTALARRIEDDGGRALALPADVGDERQARAFVEHAYEHLGRLDVLVNAAGVVRGGRVEGADTERWRETVRVNVLGLLYCTHAALPVMRAQGGGDIVNLACRAGPGSAIHALTAAAVAAFSEELREEASRLGVRVIVVEAAARRDPEEVAEALVAAIEQPAIQPTGQPR